VRRPAHSAWTAVLVLVASCCGAACGPDRPSDIPTDELPEYNTDTAGPFDDTIASVVFTSGVHGMDHDASQLAEMAQLSDYVLPARLKALSKNRTRDRVTYVLLIEPVGATLRGASPDPTFELQAGASATSLLRAVGNDGLGKEFIVFLKRYRSTNEARWHFRIVPDTPEVRAAIQQVD